MLTFFTTAKPFEGHSGIIQRNALTSWKLLNPSIEVILFGDEPGAAEICAELGFRHEPFVERHEGGMKYLNFMFDRAQKVAKYDHLCYSNCDIVLSPEFYQAFQAARAWRKKFLLIGQRWDTDITEPLDFADPFWPKSLRELVKTKGFLQHRNFIDYFLFSKGLYNHVPPLVVGRSYWDWWIVWKARSRRAAVVDSTKFALAVHQNHGYAYHPGGKQGTHTDPLAERNKKLAGNGTHLRNMLSATHELSAEGKITRLYFRRQYVEWNLGERLQPIINLTYPLRRTIRLLRAKVESKA